MGAFLHEMVRFGIYKRTQGKITRQVTFAVLVVVIGLGLARLSSILKSSSIAENWANWFGQYAWLAPFQWLAKGCALVSATGPFYLWFPGLLLLLAAWACYRLVNVPSFADFLIAVEAEMNKVSWPTKPELYRASMVVLVVIVVLAAMMSLFDVLWRALLHSGLHII